MVVDYEFNILHQYQAVVNQNDAILLGMNDWCKKTHLASGLIAEVRASDKSEQQVEAELCQFISKHLTEKGRLTGNSIHFDRRFIRQYWPQFDKTLNYRMVDASSFLEAYYVAFGWDGEHDRTEVAHRAVADTLDSVGFLKKMLSTVDVEKLLANDFTWPRPKPKTRKPRMSKKRLAELESEQLVDEQEEFDREKDE